MPGAVGLGYPSARDFAGLERISARISRLTRAERTAQQLVYSNVEALASHSGSASSQTRSSAVKVQSGTSKCTAVAVSFKSKLKCSASDLTADLEAL